MLRKLFVFIFVVFVCFIDLFASCLDGYVDRGSGCVLGWFVDETLGEAVVEVVKYNGYSVTDETDLTHAMMEEIEHLDVSGMQIFSLDGIYNLENLKTLDASGNLFTDIDALGNMQYLELLNLSHNDIQSISSINGGNLVTLDISNTNVFNFTSVAYYNNIELLVVSNDDMVADTLFRGSTETLTDFVQNNNLDACWTTSLIPEKPVWDGQSGYVGGFQTRRTITDCGSNGTCTNGQCDCDTGYALVNGYCYADSSSSCLTGEAFEAVTNDHVLGGEIEICIETSREFLCGDYLTNESKEPYSVTANYSNSYYDFGTKTRTECHYNDQTCNTSSSCLFKCADGYSISADNKNCVADAAYREIGPDSVKNLVFPKIVRKDVALEPIQGIPSFVPTYSFKWMEDAKGKQRGYWSVDIPNLQMHYKNNATGMAGVVWLLSHNFYKLTVSMPWGTEEYSQIENLGCFESNGAGITCGSPDSYYEKWVILPSPGQRNHNHIELFKYDSSPYWIAKRFGEDGSEAKFELGHEVNRYFHDPFPITYYKTRDGKQVDFDYTRNSTNPEIVESVEITDPADRVVEVEFAGTELNGGLFLYDHLVEFEKNAPDLIKMYVNQNLMATYDNSSEGFNMTATINYLRKDVYTDESNASEKKYRYKAKDLYNQDLGPETFIKKVTNGYQTEQFVVEDENDHSHWLVKKETLPYWSNVYNIKPWDWDKYYKKNYSSDLDFSGSVKTTSYGTKENDTYYNYRKIEETYSPWLQPIKKMVCKLDEDGNCLSGHSSTEKFGYNINGALVFHRDGNGDTEMVLYNYYDITADNYILKYKYGTTAEKAKLKKAGKPLYKTKYSRDVSESALNTIYQNSVADNVTVSNWSTNSTTRRGTSFTYTEESESTLSLTDVWDLEAVVTPDGVETEYILDYEVTGSTDFGKVVRKIVDNGTLLDPVCYSYNTNGMLEKQGVWNGSSCDYKKEFSFITNSVFMKSDNMLQNVNSVLTPVLHNYYYYDTLGRKISDKNSAGIFTLYHYDFFNRVVQTDFGCSPTSNITEDQLFTPENYGFTFPFGTFDCGYSRYYSYDEMNNLETTVFEEEYVVTDTPSITTSSGNDKLKIAQITEYDFVGRPVSNCQFDDVFDNEHDQVRCIETKHDALGNIIEKTEKNSTRVITYDHFDRPLSVAVDDLQTEEYTYSTTLTSGYYGYDIIENKYGKQTFTYYDKWGRDKKMLDPFGSYVLYTYDDTNYRNMVTLELTYDSGDQKIGETAWTYDDTGRKSVETQEQFVPGNESSTAVYHSTSWSYDSVGNIEEEIKYSGTSPNIVYSAGVAYTYDEDLNVLTKTSNYEYINSNWVEKSFVENEYNGDGRLYKKKFNSNDKIVTEEYDFDDLGRITEKCTTDDTSNNTRCRYKLYNTGGNVIWSADEEADTDDTVKDSPLDIYLGIWVGNEKYYVYNDFGDIKKTVFVMTNDGLGRGSDDPNLWLDPARTNSTIMTTYDYDSYGRLTSKKNDRQGEIVYSYYSDNTTSSYRKNKLYSMQTTPAPDNGYNSSDTYTDPGSSSQTYYYVYDEIGDVEEVDSPDGMIVSYATDSYGRVTGKSTDGYDNPVTQTFSYSDNGVDRNLLIEATDGDVTVTRSYDSFNSPYSETIDWFTYSWTVSRKMKDSKIYQFTYPDGKVIEREYSGSHLDQIRYGSASSPAIIATYARTDGVVTSKKVGPNPSTPLFTETFSYDDWNKLSGHVANDGTNDIYDMSYTYSRAWHLIGKDNGMTSKSDEYTYDSYYRLKQIDYDVSGGTPDRTDTFNLDGVHNLEQSTENSVTNNWGIDKLNRVREKKNSVNDVDYSYDGRNNMTFEDYSGTSDDVKYVYDDLNRLVEIKEYYNSAYRTSIEYAYDAFNRRFATAVKDYPGAQDTDYRHVYIYDDWNIATAYKYVYGGWFPTVTYKNVIDSGMDQHVAIENTSGSWTTTSTLYYFISDERNNVVAFTDDTGSILERYRYRAYGEHVILNSNHAVSTCSGTSCYAGDEHNFLWGGSLLDSETDLYWMRNRYYHKGMHRFINQDPIGIWGDANNLGNGFAYVAGMVIEATDPTGLAPVAARSIGLALSSWAYDIANHGGRNPSGAHATMIAYADLYNARYGDAPNSIEVYGGLALFAVGLAADNYNKIQDFISGLCDDGAWYDTGETGERTLVETDENGDAVVIVFQFKIQRNSRTQKTREVYDDGTVVEVDENGHETCEGPKCKELGFERPADPEFFDSAQSFFANQLLKKMLIIKDKKRFEEFMEEEGPVIKYEDNGMKIFVFNPYYKGKDPMKEEIWRVKNADGTWGFVRNPFIPSNAPTWSNTYEKFEQTGFFQPEVDPYEQVIREEAMKEDLNNKSHIMRY